MGRGRNISGLILILIGLGFLGANLGLFRFSWNLIWPIFILVPGLLFEFGYFMKPSRANAGLLVPGGILLVISGVFYTNIFFGWHMMSHLWPLFLMAPAFGLFQLFLFGGREPGLLIPVFILGGLSLFFMTFTLLGSFSGYLIPLVLIGIGFLVLSGKGQKHNGHYEYHFGRRNRDNDDIDDDDDWR